jgi:hypothetical protein
MIQWNPDNCKTRLIAMPNFVPILNFALFWTRIIATVFWVPRSCNYPGFTVYAFLT